MYSEMIRLLNPPIVKPFQVAYMWPVGGGGGGRLMFDP